MLKKFLRDENNNDDEFRGCIYEKENGVTFRSKMK